MRMDGDILPVFVQPRREINSYCGCIFLSSKRREEAARDESLYIPQ